MTDFRVLIADGLEGKGQSILRGAAVVEDRAGISPKDLLETVAGFDALVIASRTKVTSQVIQNSELLKVVGKAGADVDNVDLEAAKARGVIVVNAPAAAVPAVAELAFGFLLSLARRIPQADAAVKSGRWSEAGEPGVELGGKTLGIVGYGRTGMEVGKRAAAFGMNVVAYDPFVAEHEIHAGGAEAASLQELYAWSDFISLHIPYNVHTRDLIGPLALSQMKNGVRLISVAGTGMIDESALLEALNSGKVGGAAIDVGIPDGGQPGALSTHPGVIATPHIGGMTTEANARASVDIAQEVLAALRGEPLRWKIG
jgi:D-3-phosphoglycerate dehydrogenase / 2-oxoglutarate reductase